MKYIKRFNESIRDEVRDGISSSLKTSGHLVQYEQEIKNDILSYIDELLDDEVESIHQMAQLQKGEISKEDVDMEKIMTIGKKVNQALMDIISNYMKK